MWLTIVGEKGDWPTGTESAFGSYIMVIGVTIIACERNLGLESRFQPAFHCCSMANQL